MFKSLLFLCAGGYIHSFNESQDIRLIGGGALVYPVTSGYFVGCSFSICGFPFLAGFYSKDLILETILFEGVNTLFYVGLLAGVLMTVAYSGRLVYYVYIKGTKVCVEAQSERDWSILAPITVLFVVSVLVGAGYT